MSAAQSLPAATTKLRTIAVESHEIAVEVLGPELSVGIIVPTFGDREFLTDALRSIQAQTHAGWHCYVIDDASPEDVDHVITEFEQDQRITFLRHGSNAGLAAARNTGVRFAREDLLLFLDADDLLTPWSLEVRVAEMRQHWYDPTVAGVHGQILQCTEETSLDDTAGWRQQPEIEARDWLSSKGESPFTVHAPLTRRSVVMSLGGFDEGFVNGAEDWDFWHRVLRHGFRFMPVHAVVGGYRQRRASMIREHASIHLQRANQLFAAAQQWAIVDEDVAVANARMPLGDANIGLLRLNRAARWAGLEAARSGTVGDSISNELLSFVDPARTVGTRREECVGAARGGVVRGLGLSVHLLDRVESDAREVIDALASEIADALLDYCSEPTDAPPGTVDLVRRITPDVAIVADTAADVPVLARVREDLTAEGLDVVVVDTDYARGDEGAGRSWAALEIPTVPYNSVVLGKCRPSVVLARSPGHPVTLDLLTNATTWGGRGVYLSEPDRELQLPEAASAGHHIESATPQEVVALARQGRPETCGPSDWRGSNFAALLPAEESPLDPAGSAWLRDHRDSKRGETVVIIGNGPSLNVTDLGLLAGHDTFGVNSIFLADDRLPEPLTYYVVEDTAVFKDNTAAVKAYEAGTKLFPTIYRHHFTDEEVGENTVFFRMNQGFYGRNARGFGPTGTLCHPRFSANAAERVFCGQSVTIINLQLAYWLGYSRVVLIGMDFSYTIPDDAERDGNLIVSRSDDPNHFHPDYFGAGKTWKDPKLDRVLVNYRLAKEMFEADGREIVNATVGGNLDLFRRASLEEALRQA